MSLVAKFALLSVVFVDIMGQGLFFPILNTLVMDPATNLLPHDATRATRELVYGLVIATYFLSWFFGAPYISRLSDSLGRKPTMLFCLMGGLLGYVLTLASLYMGNLALLLLGRAITGFTAGNQPIAQAALVDGSADDVARSRNMGYVITATSAGMLGGPLIGGLSSDPAILGSLASLKLPFYISAALVGLTALLVLFTYKDVRVERGRFVFRPLEIFEVLIRIREFPLVVRSAIVLFFFHVTNMTYYIFISNFMHDRWGYGTLGTSAVMAVIGVALAFSSFFLVVPAQHRFDKRTIMGATFAIWFLCALGTVTAPFALLCFVYVFFFYFAFGVAYPTMLSIFSLSVGADEQGWVMGMTMAVFTLVGGTMSLIGGWLTSINVDLPFIVIMVAAVVAVIAMRLVWRHHTMDPVLNRPGK